MEPIVQEDAYGCGVACVANILGIPYQDTLIIFADGKEKATNIGFYCKDIVWAFKQKNVEYDYKYIKSRIKNRIYKERVIVYLRRCKKYPVGHFVCRMNKMWLDSWINFPDINKKSGIRKRLPEKPIYIIFPVI